MLIIIPTRIFPGIILSCLFIFAGVGTGFTAVTAFTHWHDLRIPHLIFPPVFVVAALYVVQAWRGQTEEHDIASKMTFFSPRLLAVLLGVCLAVGLFCGGLIGYISQANS